MDVVCRIGLPASQLRRLLELRPHRQYMWNHGTSPRPDFAFTPWACFAGVLITERQGSCDPTGDIYKSHNDAERCSGLICRNYIGLGARSLFFSLCQDYFAHSLFVRPREMRSCCDRDTSECNGVDADGTISSRQSYTSIEITKLREQVHKKEVAPGSACPDRYLKFTRVTGFDAQMKKSSEVPSRSPSTGYSHLPRSICIHFNAREYSRGTRTSLAISTAGEGIPPVEINSLS